MVGMGILGLCRGVNDHVVRPRRKGGKGRMPADASHMAAMQSLCFFGQDTAQGCWKLLEQDFRPFRNMLQEEVVIALCASLHTQALRDPDLQALRRLLKVVASGTKSNSWLWGEGASFKIRFSQSVRRSVPCLVAVV